MSTRGHIHCIEDNAGTITCNTCGHVMPFTAPIELNIMNQLRCPGCDILLICRSSWPWKTTETGGNPQKPA